MISWIKHQLWALIHVWTDYIYTTGLIRSLVLFTISCATGAFYLLVSKYDKKMNQELYESETEQSWDLGFDVRSKVLHIC